MPGVIALIVAILVFWLVLKLVFLIGAVLIGLAAAVAVYFVAEKLLNKAR
jgi:multisubunit Na+/H+ antiporter MnhE subunit